MTAPLEVSRQGDRAFHETLSAPQAEKLRERLWAEIVDWIARFAQEAAMFAKLTINSSVDPTGLNRALAALHKYNAIDAIDELHDALVRFQNGRYGTCQWCDRPIPFERLDIIPDERFCAACRTAVDPPSRSQHGLVRGGRTGVLPPSRALAVEGFAHDPRVLAESRARHPSSVRYAISPRDPAHDERSPRRSRKPERDAPAP